MSQTLAERPDHRSNEATRIPGEPGIWVLVLGDMVMFAVFFGLFLHARSEDPVSFADSRLVLNQDFGAINTLLLLTSSLLVAMGVASLRSEDRTSAARSFAWAGVCAAGFMVVKAAEYSSEISHGYTPVTNDFFMYFFALTGLHLAHLVIGSVLLVLMWRTARRPQPRQREQRFIECCAVYWHMVDLLWVVLFPLLYLVSTR